MSGYPNIGSRFIQRLPELFQELIARPRKQEQELRHWILDLFLFLLDRNVRKKNPERWSNRRKWKRKSFVTVGKIWLVHHIFLHLLQPYERYTANIISIPFSHLMPGGYMPRLEIMERECWKFLDWRLNSDNDSRLHGQPSFSRPMSEPSWEMKMPDPHPATRLSSQSRIIDGWFIM